MKKIITLLTVGFVLSLNTSCLKKQDLYDDKLGPAFAPEALTEAVSQGIGRYSYDDIKQGEFTSFIVTQNIQDTSTTSIEQQDMTIKSFENTDEYMKIESLVTRTSFSDGQNSQSSREWTDTFKKISSQPTNSSKQLSPMDATADRPTYLFFTLERIALGSCFSDGEDPQTCHNLTVSDFKLQVPASAAPQHGCADVNQCYIDARRIEFDVVNLNVIDKDGKPQRVHLRMVVSKDVPFLSKMLQLCERKLYEITNSQQKVLAEICYKVNNYAFGTK